MRVYIERSWSFSERERAPVFAVRERVPVAVREIEIER
jgi:hypothetical protein